MQVLRYKGKDYVLVRTFAQELSISTSYSYSLINLLSCLPINAENQPIYPDPNVRRQIVPVDYISQARSTSGYQMRRIPREKKGHDLNPIVTREYTGGVLAEMAKLRAEIEQLKGAGQTSIPLAPSAPIRAATVEEKRELNRLIAQLCCESPLTKKAIWESITNKFGKIHYDFMDTITCEQLIAYVKSLTTQYLTAN